MSTKNTISEFAQEQISFIQSEQNTEVEETTAAYKQLSHKQLVDKGVAMFGLKLTSLKSGIGGRSLLQFEAGIGGMERLPESSKFKVGDVVEVGKHENSKKKRREQDGVDTWNFSGTVSRVSEQAITVSIKHDLPGTDQPDLFTVTKMANTVSYKRMQDAMRWLEKQDASPSSVASVLFGLAKPRRFPVEDEVIFYDDTLNEPQKKAVLACVEAEELSLIHGPPGTGKTHTCVEVIRQLAKRKKRILVCGPSNISVDNLVERLAKCKLDLVRIGHPSRILDSVQQYALDVRLYSSDEGQIVNEVKKELDFTLDKASKTKRKGDRHALYQEAKALRKELRVREKTVLESTIRNAQVILSTLNGAASKILFGEQFDVVMIDEASQALEAESWIAIQKGSKLILAGDHLQLPPTIQSKKGAAQKALSLTLFERLLNLYGDSVKTLLNIQYRMHIDIMSFSSDYFYEGKLVCGAGVENRLLIDLEGIEETDDTSIPLVFIDTCNHDFMETSSGGFGDDEGSKSNAGEVELVKEYVRTLVKAGVKDSDIVVISPYSAQIANLKIALKEEFSNIELGTVDGIQGREKECVILSLVRSNDRGEVGFLAESRRLNVAITRPKRHLCLVGNSQTLERDKCLQKFIAYFEERGEIRYPPM